MEIGIILLIGMLFFLIFCWIFNIDFKSILTTLIVIGIIIAIIIFIFVPEIRIKYRIVNETNKYQTQQDITKLLTKEEIEYYKLAMLFKPNECMNHTVNHIIKIGEDLSKIKISDYFN